MSIKTIDLDGTTTCICKSPLQAQLLINIILRYKIKPVVFYFGGDESPRTLNYLEKIKKLSKQVYFINLEKKRTWQVLLELAPLLLRHRAGTNNLILASFNSFYPQVVAGLLKPNAIGLFDDGSFSILSDLDRAPYLKKTIGGLFYNLALHVLGIETNPRRLLKSVSFFLTIFPRIQTLVARSMVIPMEMNYEKTKPIASPLEGTITFYAGDVREELSEELKALEDRILELPEINYLLPHPRTVIEPKHRNKALSIDIIAEEYINQILSSGWSVNLVSLNSTVLWTAPRHPKLNRIIVQSKTLKMNLPSLGKHLTIRKIKSVDPAMLPRTLGSNKIN